MAGFGSNESCPNCGAQMATDQRYCLNCGHRRGEPRLPFMDAVVFMESMNAPGGGGAAATPPPPPAASNPNRWNANAALIAGVATLVLAIGVGFLIGRSGHDNSTQAAAPIRVINAGGAPATGGEETAAATPEATTGGTDKAASAGAKGKSNGAGKSGAANPAKVKSSEVKEGSKQEEELAAEKTKEVLHSTVESVKPTAKLGESCEKGVAGCSSNGKFEGNFFGE
jgi:hypothetical protein